MTYTTSFLLLFPIVFFSNKMCEIPCIGNYIIKKFLILKIYNLLLNIFLGFHLSKTYAIKQLTQIISFRFRKKFNSIYSFQGRPSGEKNSCWRLSSMQCKIGLKPKQTAFSFIYFITSHIIFVLYLWFFSL